MGLVKFAWDTIELPKQAKEDDVIFKGRTVCLFKGGVWSIMDMDRETLTVINPRRVKVVEGRRNLTW